MAQTDSDLNEIMQSGPDAASAQPSKPEESFFYDSFSDVLRRAIGYYAICSFLIGNNNLEERSGIIYAAGVNFMTLYNPNENNYTVCDIYALKFATIYDTDNPLVLARSDNVRQEQTAAQTVSEQPADAVFAPTLPREPEIFPPHPPYTRANNPYLKRT